LVVAIGVAIIIYHNGEQRDMYSGYRLSGGVSAAAPHTHTTNEKALRREIKAARIYAEYLMPKS
jgi:hypothetical protein